ncbi:DrmB family protein [Saccharothrix isguenensis]
MEGIIRRAQLIAPFGVGSMSVLANGTSVIGAGLDHWFAKPEHSDLDLSEFEVSEWRLQQRLKVGGFRLPPDFRMRESSGAHPVNVGLTVPFLRFPTWSFCPYSGCKRLKQHPLSLQEKPACDAPIHAGAKYDSLMVQVSFVAICENGHIMDFPWREWVHRSVNPACRGELKLISTGGGTLDGQRVECECGVRPRTLRDVTIAGPDGSRLTSNLEDGTEFLCRGTMPWHGANSAEACAAPIRASLRGASNVYFAQVASSIYLPQYTTGVQDALDILHQPTVGAVVSAIMDFGHEVTPELVKQQAGPQSAGISDEDMREALRAMAAEKAGESHVDGADVGEQEFRRPEYEMLRKPSSNESLRITAVDRDAYDDDLDEWLDRVTLVDRLRETRALWGFSRVYPQPPSREAGKAMLRATAVDYSEQWLPAYEVYGEGIYLEFDAERLAEWESRLSVADRIARLVQLSETAVRGDTRTGPLTARMVLIHTFAHLLINQLVFECGYSSAALRERLFVSEAPDAMSGLLVYTASGDSEGTMGGLVRMGRPGRLEPVLRSARENAAWCASDPVCMDVGESGQGPESCNLAACHSCALLPETACEEFNRFLDRAMLVGTINDPTVGFFNS